MHQTSDLPPPPFALCPPKPHPPPPPPQSLHFSFCGHPWIYDPASKAKVLQLENQIEQLKAFETSMMQVGARAVVCLLSGARGWQP